MENIRFDSNIFRDKMVHKKLMSEIDKSGSQLKFARKIGVSPTFLSDVMHGNRGFSDRILYGLGLEHVNIYVPINSKLDFSSDDL